MRANQTLPVFKSPQKTSGSVSTEEESPRSQMRQKGYKEKSQLCKKFVENGCCPYQFRCKFAHGLHELKKNYEFNSKYKTKMCVAFTKDGHCVYGNRCNFIHQLCQPHTIRVADPIFALIQASTKQQSALIKMLNL